jgi:tetratricopeptide (TPR) repeat protein
LEVYHHAVAVDPASRRARGNLCNLQRALKQLPEAAACYIKLSKLQPNDGMTRALIGDALFFAHAQRKEKHGETPAVKAKVRRAVVKHLKDAVTLNPSLADVYANIGKMYEDGGQLGSAKATLPYVIT